MKKIAAKQMLEGIYAKQFLKHAEGLLDSAASSYKKRVSMADNAMAKLTAPKPATAPIAAPSSAPPATKLTRWPFDRPGTGDAQARAAIVDGAKQLGSKLPTPSSSYAYGPGGGGAGLPDVAGAARGAVRAVSEALPKPSSSYAYGPGGGGAPAGKPTGFDSRKATADYQAKLDRGAAAAQQTPPQRSTYAYGMGPASAAGQAQIAAAQTTATPPPTPTTPASAPPQRSTYAYGMGPASAAGQAQIAAAQTTTTPPSAPVQNPLTQPVPGRNIELMPDGTPDTSSLIDTPRTQTTPATPQPPAGNSPQAWGSAGAGPGGAPAAPQNPAPVTPQQPETPPATQAAQPAPANPAAAAAAASGGMGAASAGAAAQQAANQAQTTNFQKLQDTTTSVLSDAKATPEAKQKSMQELMQAHADANKDVADGLKDKLAGKQTPASAAFDKSFETAANDEVDKAYREWKASNPNSTPQQDGSFIGNMWNQIQSMPPEAQGALALGIPLAVLGLGMSAFGGGGLGSLLMSVLGVGAIGAGAASMGVFGEGAQNAVTGSIGGLGKMFAPMFGVNLPDEGDIRNRLTAAAKQGPQQAQAELEKVRAEVAPYARYSPEAQKFMNESAAKDYLYNQAQQYGRDNYSELGANASPFGKALFGAPKMKDDNPGKRDWNDWWYGAPGSAERERNIQSGLQRAGWEKPAAVQIMLKAARCWAGYEPVPGTKAYSEGSCRPKGSKKTKKEVIQGKKHTEKKAVQQFDVEHARRVFTENPIPGMNPATATPTQLHARMRNIVNPTSNHTNSTAAKLFREQYNNQMPAMPQPRAPVPQSQAPAAPAQAAPAPQPTIPKRPTMIQAPTNTAAMPPIQPGSGGKKPYPMTQQPVRKPPEDPVAAIDRRLARRGIDPSKPVFTRPPQPVVAAPQPSMRAAVTAVKPPVR